MKPSMKDKISWEDEFDREFGIILYAGSKTKMANHYIKSFISSLLEEEHDTWFKLCDEMNDEILKLNLRLTQLSKLSKERKV